MDDIASPNDAFSKCHSSQLHDTHTRDNDAMHRRPRYLPLFTLFILGTFPCSSAFAPDVNFCSTCTRHDRRIIAISAHDGSRSVKKVRRDDCTSSTSMGFTFRTGKPSDQPIITKTMVSQFMNPLGLDPKRFCVAETRDGQLIGWGQIKPLGMALYDASKYNSSPGSGNIGDSIDEDIWLEFEGDDSVEFPNGLSSLPWSPSYRKAAEAAKRRRDKRAIMLGRERMDTPQIFELSSIYVFPQFRSQGVGRSIVRELLHRHTLDRDISQIYALTLRKTLNFYDALGFQVVEKEEIPSQLKLEIALGRIITKALGEELVCLKASRVM